MTILPYLETFAAVLDKGSFTAAAEYLQISKPVVSKQISQLEKRLGVQLLHRTTRQLKPTEAGDIFAHYTLDIMKKVQEAEQAVLPLQGNPQGLLRITVPESLAASKLSDVLHGFIKQYPRIELDILVSGQFVNLLEAGIDVALRAGKLEDSTLVAKLLAPCRFHVCASPDYWKKHGIPKHPEELKTQNCLIYTQRPKSNTWFFKEKNNDDLTIKITGNLKSSSGKLILNAALAGQGVFFAPSYMVINEMNQGKLIPVLEDYLSTSVGLYAVYPHSHYVSAKVRIFIDYLTTHWSDEIRV